VVFHDSTLSEIADRLPRTSDALRTIRGVGDQKMQRYGHDVVRVVSAFAG
jgi:ATP-dependent DNA helicase RecQ